MQCELKINDVSCHPYSTLERGLTASAITLATNIYRTVKMIIYLAFLLLSASTLAAQNWTLAHGPPGCDNPRLVNHPRDSRVALLLHEGGDVPLLTTDGGVKWKRLDSMAKFSYVFRETNLIFTYDDGIVIAFAVDTSIARSTDLGDTWTWTPSEPKRGSLIQLAHNPFEPASYIAFGLSAERETLITFDGGNTWDLVRFEDYPDGLSLSRMNFAPSEPGVVYSHYKNALAVSKDGGRSFELIPHQLLSMWSPDDLMVDPIDEQRIYMAYRNQFAVTRDGGISWRELKLPVNGPDVRVIQSKSDRRVFWASDTALHRSSDNGASWKKINGPWTHGTITVGELNGSVTVSVPFQGLFATNDVGDTWQRLDTNIRLRSVERIFMRDDTHWVAQCDTEILRTSDAGSTWETILRDGGIPGYNWLRINDLASIDNWDTLIVSAHPIGYVTHNGGTWQKIVRPIGFASALLSINWHRDNPRDILAVTPNRVARSRDGGLTWIFQPVPEGFEGSLIARGSASTTTWLKSTKETYKLGVSNDEGNTWSYVDAREAYPHGIIASRSCSDCFFHVSSNETSGGLSFTRTAGKDWTRIFKGTIYKGHIATDPTDADLVYIYTIEGSILRFNTNTANLDTLYSPSIGPPFRTPLSACIATTGTTFLVSTFRGLQRLSLSPTSVSIAPTSNPAKVFVSPTPATEYFDVQVNAPLANIIEITSLTGSVVRRIDIDEPSALTSAVRISTDGLVPGVYGVRVGNAFGVALIIRGN